MSESPTVTLDQDQARVAYAHATARLYVVAGPGSGKTGTGSARLTHLAEEEELSGDSLLVISFSRAAVEAVQRRQRKNSPHTAAWITTLDSLAARLLTDAGVDVTDLGIDARIKRLTTALKEDPDVVDQLAHLEHLMVDEVQDVVGFRADLMTALIGALPSFAGFTLLGDPLQGIYDFQLVPGTATAEQVQQRSIDLGAEVVQLHGQYRAQTEDAVRAMATRREGQTQAWIHALEDHVSTMPLLAPEEVAEWAGGSPGTLAVLTQSNAQALIVARELHGRGIAAELLGPAIDRPVAPWIARDLRRVGEPIDYETFTSLSWDEDEELLRERWLRLRSVARPTGRYLDVGKVASRLATGIVPVGLRSERSRVTISTIHRAKGLEFDRVLLLDPSTWYRVDDDKDAYARALYVAITRPRNRLFTFAPPNDASRWGQDGASQRAVRCARGKRGIVGFEIRGSDWRTNTPPDASGDPEATQAPLAEIGPDAPPQAVELRFNAYDSTSFSPSYDAYLGDRLIGSLGEAFKHDFVRRTDRNDRWPDIEGLHLTGVETVAGPKQSGTVGQNGLWLSPLITGPASLNWRR